MKHSNEANNERHQTNEPTASTFGRYNYASTNFANWRPWGLYETLIPPPFEAAFSKALEQLKAENSKDRETLLDRLMEIAVVYWENRRGIERPPIKWSRDHVQSIRDETENLLLRLKSGKPLQISGLAHRTKYQMNRSLVKQNTCTGDPNPLN